MTKMKSNVRWMICLLIVLLAAVMTVAQTPPPVESKPLTPIGQMAVKTIHQEINQVQADIAMLVKAELEAQHLKAEDGWQLNLQTDQLQRVVQKPVGEPEKQKAPQPLPNVPDKPADKKLK